MNTQGMSFGSGKTGRSVEEQRDAIPPMQVNKMNLISDSLKVELKQLINEVLDEREHQKQLEGPYDFPENEDDGLDYEDEWLYRGTY
tara:strand:- start:130 stop:390 length:261 start_codon:yes stop_codon:yes gene_type:complete